MKLNLKTNAHYNFQCLYAMLQSQSVLSQLRTSFAWPFCFKQNWIVLINPYFHTYAEGHLQFLFYINNIRMTHNWYVKKCVLPYPPPQLPSNSSISRTPINMVNINCACLYAIDTIYWFVSSLNVKKTDFYWVRDLLLVSKSWLFCNHDGHTKQFN